MQNSPAPEYHPIHPTNQPDMPRVNVVGVAQGQPQPAPIAQFAFQSHTGPLPLASELAAYDKIQPDLVNRIVCMAEANGQSEREQIKAAQRSYFWLNLVGKFFGFVFALSSLAATVWLCLNGHDAVGGSIGVAAVGGTVAALISGKATRAEAAK